MGRGGWGSEISFCPVPRGHASSTNRLKQIVNASTRRLLFYIHTIKKYILFLKSLHTYVPPVLWYVDIIARTTRTRKLTSNFPDIFYRLFFTFGLTKWLCKIDYFAYIEYKNGVHRPSWFRFWRIKILCPLVFSPFKRPRGGGAVFWS